MPVVFASASHAAIASAGAIDHVLSTCARSTPSAVFSTPRPSAFVVPPAPARAPVTHVDGRLLTEFSSPQRTPILQSWSAMSGLTIRPASSELVAVLAAMPTSVENAPVPTANPDGTANGVDDWVTFEAIARVVSRLRHAGQAGNGGLGADPDHAGSGADPRHPRRASGSSSLQRVSPLCTGQTSTRHFVLRADDDA